jgi:hypothetical protein
VVPCSCCLRLACACWLRDCVCVGGGTAKGEGWVRSRARNAEQLLQCGPEAPVCAQNGVLGCKQNGFLAAAAASFPDACSCSQAADSTRNGVVAHGGRVDAAQQTAHSAQSTQGRLGLFRRATGSLAKQPTKCFVRLWSLCCLVAVGGPCRCSRMLLRPALHTHTHTHRQTYSKEPQRKCPAWMQRIRFAPASLTPSLPLERGVSPFSLSRPLALSLSLSLSLALSLSLSLALSRSLAISLSRTLSPALSLIYMHTCVRM